MPAPHASSTACRCQAAAASEAALSAEPPLPQPQHPRTVIDVYRSRSRAGNWAAFPSHRRAPPLPGTLCPHRSPLAWPEGPTWMLVPAPPAPPCLQTPDSSRARHQRAGAGCNPARILLRACTGREGELSSCTGCSARSWTHYTSSSQVNLALSCITAPSSYMGPRAANAAPPPKHVPKHPTCTSQLGDVPAARAEQKLFHRPCPQ